MGVSMQCTSHILILTHVSPLKPGYKMTGHMVTPRELGQALCRGQGSTNLSQTALKLEIDPYQISLQNNFPIDLELCVRSQKSACFVV